MLARAARAGLLSLLLTVAPATAFAGTWGRPFAIAAPQGGDLLGGPQIAFGAAGRFSVAYGTVRQENVPAGRVGVAIGVGGRRPPARRRVPGVGGALALAPLGRGYVLLAGSGLVAPAALGAAGPTCCRAVQALTLRADGKVAGRRTLIRGLSGGVTAQLVPIPGGGLLAAAASATGVWVATADRRGRFGSVVRLADETAYPGTLTALALPGGRTLVAWTAALAGAAVPGPQQAIAYALGSGGAAPAHPSLAATTPSGYAIDSLSAAPRGDTVTFAWTQSWYDAVGDPESQAYAADLGAGPYGGTAGVPVSATGVLAGEVTLVADARGDQLLTWSSCRTNGPCRTLVGLRGAHGRWRPPVDLGPLDPGQAPVAAAPPSGAALVAWIGGGRVRVSAATRTGLAVPRTLSRGQDAGDLALALAPSGRQALAAWSQGAARPVLNGTLLSLR